MSTQRRMKQRDDSVYFVSVRVSVVGKETSVLDSKKGQYLSHWSEINTIIVLLSLSSLPIKNQTVGGLMRQPSK